MPVSPNSLVDRVLLSPYFPAVIVGIALLGGGLAFFVAGASGLGSFLILAILAGILGRRIDLGQRRRNAEKRFEALLEAYGFRGVKSVPERALAPADAPVLPEGLRASLTHGYVTKIGRRPTVLAEASVLSGLSSFDEEGRAHTIWRKYCVLAIRVDDVATADFHLHPRGWRREQLRPGERLDALRRDFLEGLEEMDLSQAWANNLRLRYRIFVQPRPEAKILRTILTGEAEELVATPFSSSLTVRRPWLTVVEEGPLEASNISKIEEMMATAERGLELLFGRRS